MTAIIGTNVSAPIVPFDTADTFPTHDAQYGKGGFRSVLTIAARDAIPTQRRTEGMRVRVTNDPTPANNTDWDWLGGAWVLNPVLVAAEGFANDAEQAKDEAVAARDSTLLNSTVYASTAIGLAATINGQYFSVPSTEDDQYLILYMNNAGVAFEVKRYPSTVAMDDLNEAMIRTSASLIETQAEVSALRLNQQGMVDEETVMALAAAIISTQAVIASRHAFQD